MCCSGCRTDDTWQLTSVLVLQWSSYKWHMAAYTSICAEVNVRQMTPDSLHQYMCCSGCRTDDTWQLIPVYVLWWLSDRWNMTACTSTCATVPFIQMTACAKVVVIQSTYGSLHQCLCYSSFHTGDTWQLTPVPIVTPVAMQSLKSVFHINFNTP